MKKIIRAATVPSSLEVFCKVILRELSEEYEVIALSSPGSDLEVVASREGVRTIGVPMERRISPWKDIVSLFKLYKVFRTEKPDMVHSMTPKAGLLCMMASWLARVPIRVHTFTGLVWPTSTGLTRRILMTTDRITCACATHVIPEGLGVLDDLRDYKITDKSMRILGYGNIRGVDMVKNSRRDDILQAADKLSLPDCFTFMYVGRIVGDKGINELVSAFQRLLTLVKELKSEKVKKCRLVLVGPYEDNIDPLSPETQSMIENIPEIESVGSKYGDDLLAYYASSDCFVFPSYREGFPNTVLEAGAMELASIVTDINGAREIITTVSEKDKELKREKEHGESQHLMPGETMSIRENGVVIPSKNADALYEAMIWMMEHEEERLQMGKRAREIVAERWEQGFVREKLYEFYREVLGL